MKASEINLTQDGFLFLANSYPKGAHCRLLFALGRAIPSCKAQMKAFASLFTRMDVLNYDDVQKIEALLMKHGFEGNYEYTKSKRWVRLQNSGDLLAALIKEFK